MQRFKNKRILVTGSTRGIGKAVASALLREGAVVGIHGRALPQVEAACLEMAAAEGQAVPLAADLSDPEAATRLVRDFAARVHGLDGLVNNAGGGRAVAFRGLKLETWRAVFAVNLESAMLACREAYGSMRTSGGSIVNIASLAGHGPGKWMGADYAASKAGLVSLTHSLAFEAARFSIRVNAVSPGFVETDMTAALTDAMRAGLSIPLARLARPDEPAQAVLFLLSDAAAYITGEVLHVDGGLWMR